jgi:hypothetical protein
MPTTRASSPVIPSFSMADAATQNDMTSALSLRRSVATEAISTVGQGDCFADARRDKIRVISSFSVAQSATHDGMTSAPVIARRPKADEAPPRPPRVLAVEYSRWQSPSTQVETASLTLAVTKSVSLVGAPATKESPLTEQGVAALTFVTPGPSEFPPKCILDH